MRASRRSLTVMPVLVMVLASAGVSPAAQPAEGAPIDKNETPACKANNRLVEFVNES